MGRFKSLIAGLMLPALAQAMPIKSQMMKPRAYFIEQENNLLEPLDLKSKTLTFTNADFEQCGANMLRKAQTLEYSCTLTIPLKARISKLQNLVTARTLIVDFGGKKREVNLTVSPDAKQITMMTAFDHTGIDFEISKFNDDFFSVYAKVAQLEISEALHKQPVRLEVLESR